MSIWNYLQLCDVLRCMMQEATSEVHNLLKMIKNRFVAAPTSHFTLHFLRNFDGMGSQHPCFFCGQSRGTRTCGMSSEVTVAWCKPCCALGSLGERNWTKTKRRGLQKNWLPGQERHSWICGFADVSNYCSEVRNNQTFISMYSWFIIVFFKFWC